MAISTPYEKFKLNKKKLHSSKPSSIHLHLAFPSLSIHPAFFHLSRSVIIQ